MLIMVFPDVHGEHKDKSVCNAFVKDVRDFKPKIIVGLGDLVDAGGTFSAHARSFTNEMTESYEDDCAGANEFLDDVQNASDESDLRLLEGNHDQHVERWAARTFASHKDAKMLVEKFGPEAMLHLKDRGAKYFLRSEFYQGISIQGTMRIGKIFFTHGISFASNSARVHLTKFGASVVYGHVHTPQSLVQRTVISSGIGAYCPGTFSKLQPLWKHTEPTSWAHGYGLIDMMPSGNFAYFNIPIIKGKSYLPRLPK